MDPVTHGLIGTTASTSFADKRTFRATAFIGFASALMADLDVLISSASDPLLKLEMHRQFTHSLIFIPVGALITTVLLWWFVRKYLTLKQTYLFSLAGYTTAGLMDVITSYGVLLLWPISSERYSLDTISVFDPVFTMVALLLTGIAIYKKEKNFSYLALIWIALYLSFGFWQQQKGIRVAKEIAYSNHHEIQQLIVKPTIANQLLWSIRYTTGDSLYSYGIRSLPFSDPVIYGGESVALLRWKEKYSRLKGSVLYEDIRRFSDLSNGILIDHPNHKNVIGDGRYSMLPTTSVPLWGIQVDTTEPNQHVDFGTFRDARKKTRKSFVDMLLGKKLNQL